VIAPAELRLRRWISRVLLSGTVVAVAIIALGVAIGVVGGEGLEIATGSGGVLSEIAAGKPGSIVLLGIVVLTLTPVAQLTVAALAFGTAGERRYLLITLAVLALLLASLAIAAGLNPAVGG
jgi:uncharacterized membrane protein